jgi:hypothetical protein
VTLAVLGNALVLAAAGAADVAPGFMALAYPPVVALSALGAVGAVGVYALLRRYVATPDRTFRRVALAVLAVSFVPDLALLALDPAATVPGVLVLALMHVVVAAAALGLLPGGEPR